MANSPCFLSDSSASNSCATICDNKKSSHNGRPGMQRDPHADAEKLLRKEMGDKVKKEQLDEVFKSLDADGSGTLDFNEFLALVASTAMLFREMFEQAK
ncbi:hypothetical protein WMY93_026038 [Mugilogobius chulae]|uniref:EF-hand domain-containing protein n=1 Tax=Mugilogobius chulae TaxID=88201 RepID=A0AAW0N310_9GOBI